MNRFPKWTTTVVTLVFAFVAAAAHEWRLHRVLHDAHPTGDLAIFETNVRMALEGVQRFGPYSQGFRHPGPAYFYLLAVPYVISGGTTFSLYFGAQVLSMLFIAGSAVAVARSASIGPTLAFVPVVLLELSYLGDFPLFDFWPPYVLFFGYATLLSIAAALAAGRMVALVPFAALGSFLVQTHIGYTLPVLAAAAVAAAFLVRRRGAPTAWRRPGVVALGVLAVFWVLPLYAELFESAENARRIAETFLGDLPEGRRLRDLLDRVSLELTGPLQFAIFGDRFIVPDGPKHFLVARLLCVAEFWGLALAWRKARARGDRFAEALCVVCVTAALVALLALAGIRGRVAPHHTAWISAIGMVSGLAIAAGLASAPGLGKAPWGPARRQLFLAAAFAVVAIVRPISIIAGIHRNPEVAVLASAASRAARQSNAREVRIDWPGQDQGEQSPASELGVGVLLELEKSGAHFSTASAPAVDWALGRKRWERHGDALPALFVTAGHEQEFGTALSCIERGENYFLQYPLCIRAPE